MIARVWRTVEDALLVSLLLALVVFAGMQIGARNLFDGGWIFGEQLIRLGVLWVGLLGAVVASRDDRHLRIDLVSRVLPARGRAALAVLTHLLTAAVCGVVGWHAARFVLDERVYGGAAVADVPMWMLQTVLPAAFVLMSLRHAVHAGRAAREALRR